MYLPNISTQIFQPGQTMEIMETKSRLCNSHCRRDGISLLFCHFWIQNQFITRSVQNQLDQRGKLSDWSTIDNSPFSSEPQSRDRDSFWEPVVSLTEWLKHSYTGNKELNSFKSQQVRIKDTMQTLDRVANKNWGFPLTFSLVWNNSSCPFGGTPSLGHEKKPMRL